MQIRKRWSDIALQRSYPKMMHSCICFVKKVLLLPRYADRHYKMTIIYLNIYVFVAQIEGLISVSFWNTSKYPDFKRSPRYYLKLAKLLCKWNCCIAIAVAVAVAVAVAGAIAIAVAIAQTPLFSLLGSEMSILDNTSLF
jgi:hypothetical protein